VTASLLEIAATRLERQGKTAECSAKFAEVAKIYLARVGSTQAGGYNNAALAYERGFDCSGDPESLRAAERTLETAYRNAPDDPIVVGNLAHVLNMNGELRALGRRVHTRALKIPRSEVAALIGALIDGPERTRCSPIWPRILASAEAPSCSLRPRSWRPATPGCCGTGSGTRTAGRTWRPPPPWSIAPATPRGSTSPRPRPSASAR
jgi:hypothetical protein